MTQLASLFFHSLIPLIGGVANACLWHGGCGRGHIRSLCACVCLLLSAVRATYFFYNSVFVLCNLLFLGGKGAAVAGMTCVGGGVAL